MQEVIAKLSGCPGLLPLSYSKMNTLMKCPQQFKLRYLDRAEGHKAVDQESMVVGKLVHKVLEFCVQKGSTFGFTTNDVDFDLTWMQVVQQTTLTHKEHDLAQAQRVHAEKVFQRIFSSIRRYGFTALPELNLCMDLNGRSNTATKYANRFFTGFMDLFLLNKRDWSSVFFDYKTHSKNDDNAEAVRKQSEVYTYFLFDKYPSLESTRFGAIYIPEELFDMAPVITRDQLPEAKDAVTKMFLDAHDKYMLSGFAAETSKFCKWCSFSRGCAAYQATLVKSARKKKGQG